MCNNQSQDHYKKVEKISPKLPELRLPEGKTDTNTGSALEAVKTTAFLAKVLKIGLIVGGIATAYLGGSSKNDNQVGDAKPDFSQEWLDSYYAKNEALMEEKKKEGCGDLNEDEKSDIKKIEMCFKSKDPGNHVIAWSMFNTLDASTKEKILSLSLTNDYASIIIEEKIANKLFECLCEISIVDAISTIKSNYEYRYEWDEIEKNLNIKDIIVKYPNLTYANLGGSELTEFPIELLTLTSIEELHLRSNKLEVLPDIIGKLSNLKELSIASNYLSNLPESFGNLNQLKELDLNRNEFENLPESFGNLVNLQKLDLSYNNLTELPQSFGNLVNVERLLLNGNNLKALPESFRGLVKIKYLDLSGNSFNQGTKSKLRRMYGDKVRL